METAIERGTAKTGAVAPDPDAAVQEARAESRRQDQQAITALKAGDHSAFHHLINKYQRQVYSHCLRMVNDEEESYDLSQEIFLRVYKNIHNYQHNYSFYTWLYRITVNCCIDYLRKRKRQPFSVSLSQGIPGDSWESGKEQEHPDEKYVPEKSALTRELNDILNEAIDQLSDKLKVIIILKEIEGFSYDEIAEILECSRGTVKSRLFRARERLKILLGPHFGRD